MSTTTKAKVKSDVKDGGHISDLKIQRNMGNLTPEVIDMCSKHIDDMVNHFKNSGAVAAQKVKDQHGQPLDYVISALKAEPENLALVSMFMDDYDEVLKWNDLHNKNIISFDVTCHHREVDMAMFNRICNLHSRLWAEWLSKILYTYARRGSNKGI